MDSPIVSLSVVSHGQGSLVEVLLRDIERWCRSPLEVIVTHNVPEDESYLSSTRSFPIILLRNESRLGFGANHNQAFARSRGHYFLVVNPDIRLAHDPLPALLEVAQRPQVAVCGPRVLSPFGQIEDSARRFPTVASLIRRQLRSRTHSDYTYPAVPFPVDWIAGMFMAFRRASFASLGGFDSQYHMYFEDVDLCYRAHLAHEQVFVVPSAYVVHDARRSSHRSARHLMWHLSSAGRYFLRRARAPSAISTSPNDRL